MTTSTSTGEKKPPLLRTIFILNALKLLLAIGFFVAFKFFGFRVGSFGDEEAARLIMMAGLGYVVTFAAIVISILKRNLITLRVAIVLDFLVSIPPTAVIGFVIAIVSMGLTFTPSVKRYFAFRT